MIKSFYRVIGHSPKRHFVRDILQTAKEGAFCIFTRVCLENAFCKMCVTVCGKFVPDEGVVAGHDNRIRDKSSEKWGVQIAGMIFQTGFGMCLKGRIQKHLKPNLNFVQYVEKRKMIKNCC